jgi:anti-anti-sigma factor
MVDPDRRLVVDTSGLTFCGSSGIAVFVEAREEAEARGAQLRVVVPAGALRRAVEAVGLANYLPITLDLKYRPGVALSVLIPARRRRARPGPSSARKRR